jgi:hypothetical protein
MSNADSGSGSCHHQSGAFSVWTRIFALASVLLFCFSVSVGAQEKPTSLSDARAAIEANFKTAEGKAYDAALGKEFQQKYLDTLRECKKTANGDLSGFWVLMRLDEDGAVKEVLLSPATKFASCARDALLKEKFLAPPRPAYWVGIYLQLSH